MKPMASPRSHPDREPEVKQDGALVYISKAGDEGVGLPASHLLLSSKSSSLLILSVFPLFEELKTERICFLSLIPDCSLLQMAVLGTPVIQLLFSTYVGQLLVAYLAAIPPSSSEETRLLFSQPLSFGEAPHPPIHLPRLRSTVDDSSQAKQSVTLQ